MGCIMGNYYTYTFYTYTGQWMAPHISVPGTVSMLHPISCFISLLVTSMLPVSGT